MTTIFYVFEPSSGSVTGSGSSPDGTLPPGAIECTQAQARSPQNLTIVDGVIIPATASQLLTEAQTVQISTLEADYNTAIQLPVTYMATTFQADLLSQNVLTKSLVAGSVPADFYWLATNNTQVNMTFAQLQGLAGVMLVQGQVAFAKLQAKKKAVRDATTVSAVQLVSWL